MIEIRPRRVSETDGATAQTSRKPYDGGNRIPRRRAVTDVIYAGWEHVTMDRLTLVEAEAARFSLEIGPATDERFHE